MTHEQAHDHAAFRESIAAALAGGLSAAEQTAFDAHRAACADCAAEFERARQSEDRMTALFAPALPTAGLEDRVIQRLHRATFSPRRKLRLWGDNWVHPAVRTAAGGVAAVIVLGGIGLAVTAILQPPLQSARRSASNLRDLTEAVASYRA